MRVLIKTDHSKKNQSIMMKRLDEKNSIFIDKKARKIGLKKGFLILCCIGFFTSCKTIKINEVSQTATTQQVSLGMVGLNKDFLLQKEFNSAAIPSYKAPVKVMVTIASFNQHDYKNFKKAKALQAANVSVNYIDSLPNKPRYLKLQIADKVGVIQALNNETNSAVKTYLSNNKYTNVLTHISIALNKADFNAMANADAVFLVEKGVKHYVLQLYNHGEKSQLIAFNQGVVFTYKTASCCWQENDKHQLNIVDLVNPLNNCPNKTYRSAIRAKRKMNQIKF